MLRHLPTCHADGPHQMAWDEALLEHAARPVLRLYTWTPTTVSLGCFQDYDDIAPRLPAGTPVVRRITGGGAIWHEHEVTYALAGTLGQDGLPGSAREIYPLLHGAILAALAERGAALALQTQTVGDRRYRAEPRCFASPAQDDLIHLADGAKTLGSVARARDGRLLVHGSLKLASNAWDGPVVAGCGLDWNLAAEALIAGVCRALGQTTTPGDFTADESTTADHLRTIRYGDDGWVRQRSGLRP